MNRTRLAALLIVFSLCACAASPEVQEMPINVREPPQVKENTVVPVPPGGVAAEIHRLVERGTPSALKEALGLIENRGLAENEFGRVMTVVCAALIQRVYPDLHDLQTIVPRTYPIQTHVYGKILLDAARSVYTPCPASSTDYLQHILPFLALLRGKTAGTPPDLDSVSADLARKITSDLEAACEINPDGVLSPYFLGLLYEAEGRLDDARAQYEAAREQSEDCYGATLALSRLLAAREEGRQEPIALLSGLCEREPDNLAARQALAEAYYGAGDYGSAEKTVDTALSQAASQANGVQPAVDPLVFRAILLLKARTSLALAQPPGNTSHYREAQAALDRFQSLSSTKETSPSGEEWRQYLFLRGRVNAEGFHDEEAAMANFREILQIEPRAREARLYLTRLLLASEDEAHKTEGRLLLQQFLTEDTRNPLPDAVIDLAIEDALRREAWEEAETYLTPRLESRRSLQDLLSACTIAHNRGDHAGELELAREIHERFPEERAGMTIYAEALIDAGQAGEARSFINSTLETLRSGTEKSHFLVLRSRLPGATDTQILEDLRAALFENPRSLEALVAMFEVYHRRKESSRARYYLKQALALSPNDSALKAWNEEYE